MKRLISVILILCMLFALSTFTLSAAGSNSVRETPYAVRSGPYLFVNFGQKYDWAVNASFVALAVPSETHSVRQAPTEAQVIFRLPAY